MTSDGNNIGIFKKQTADILGIPPESYILAKEQYHKDFKFPQDQYILSGYPVDHSKCGYMPTAMTQSPTRGVSVEQNGEDITLTTLIIHIKYDAATGSAMDIYSPLGYKGIKDLTWNLPYIKI